MFHNVELNNNGNFIIIITWRLFTWIRWLFLLMVVRLLRQHRCQQSTLHRCRWRCSGGCSAEIAWSQTKKHNWNGSNNILLEWTKLVCTPALGVYLWGIHSLTHSWCQRHVERNYVPLFGVQTACRRRGKIERRLTLLRNTWRDCYLNTVVPLDCYWTYLYYNMYNSHPSLPPSLPPSHPPSIPPSLPPPTSLPSLPPLPSPPSLPLLPSPPLPPSLHLVTQQIHCPFQRKQSPSLNSRNAEISLSACTS